MTDAGAKRQTDPTVRQRIGAALAVNEKILSAALDKARASFDNPGNKGDAVEDAVREFLRAHLPSKYRVGQGEVIDRFGARTSQLDVIVLNDEQPFTYGSSDAAMYLCEGVSAAAEVKSVMATKELLDTLAKGERFRKLRTTYDGGAERFTNPSDARRFYVSAPFFALAIESKISAETILQTLLDHPEVESPEPDGGTLPALDALFVLDKGVFLNLGDGQGGFASWDPVFGHYQEGWVFHSHENVLVSLFTWLNAVMPRVRRFSSIAVPYMSVAADASGPIQR